MNAISVRLSLASALSGRSSPPRRWSRVDLPTPEAPIRATLSPGLTSRLAPRRTRTISGPIRYSFSMSCAASSGSLIAQDLDGVELGSAAGRRQRGQDGDQQRGGRDEREVEPRELHRQVVDLIHVARQPDDLVRVLDPDEQQPEEAA